MSRRDWTWALDQGIVVRIYLWILALGGMFLAYDGWASLLGSSYLRAMLGIGGGALVGWFGLKVMTKTRFPRK